MNIFAKTTYRDFLFDVALAVGVQSGAAAAAGDGGGARLLRDGVRAGRGRLQHLHVPPQRGPLPLHHHDDHQHLRVAR